MWGVRLFLELSGLLQEFVRFSNVILFNVFWVFIFAGILWYTWVYCNYTKEITHRKVYKGNLCSYFMVMTNYGEMENVENPEKGEIRKNSDEAKVPGILDAGKNTGDDLSGTIGKDKIEALKKAVSEINEMISNRQKLSSEVVSDGERIKMEISNFLEENKIQNPDDPVEVQERSALRRKKVDVSELQLNEKINCWRDVALLKKELRDKEKELTERESRMDMFSDILNSADSIDELNSEDENGK